MYGGLKNVMTVLEGWGPKFSLPRRETTETIEDFMVEKSGPSSPTPLTPINPAAENITALNTFILTGDPREVRIFAEEFELLAAFIGRRPAGISVSSHPGETANEKESMAAGLLKATLDTQSKIVSTLSDPALGKLFSIMGDPSPYINLLYEQDPERARRVATVLNNNLLEAKGEPYQSGNDVWGAVALYYLLNEDNSKDFQSRMQKNDPKMYARFLANLEQSVYDEWLGARIKSDEVTWDGILQQHAEQKHQKNRKIF